MREQNNERNKDENMAYKKKRNDNKTLIIEVQRRPPSSESNDCLKLEKDIIGSKEK